jgi:hypothetical protein
MCYRLLSVAAALSLVVGSASADVPVFAVQTDRDTYPFAAPVWFYVTVGNEGPNLLEVENPQCSRTTTRIEITDEAGRTFPMTGPASCATTILEEIPPGQEMLYAFELLEFYGVDGANEYPFGILPPGEYSVRYRTADHLTEPVPFTVGRLQGGDSAAFHAYVQLLSETRAENLRESTVRFREFVERFPESPYAAALLCRAGVVSDLFFDSAQAVDDFEQLIALYPESGYASVAVRHLAFGMGRDRSRGLEVLRRLPHEMPGTFAATLAERVLDRLERERG